MFRFSESFREIADGIFLTGEIPRITGFETGDAGLFCDESGCNPDQVIDDQAMAIRGEKGMVVVLGCCHAGIINTLSLITQRTGCGEFYAVIGGTHLGYASPERLDSTLRELRRYNVRRFCACHCTGFPAAVRLAKDLPGRFQHVQVGYSLEF
jgi:7,8-dihydropterin-6-yl-methyl-4-(beta-D-ribofuranosyl)aminobenzene 5'-phosphate synthase